MADENEKPRTAMADALERAEENRGDYQSEGGELSRRKPGRPPKTTAGVDNTVDVYRPSERRNNLDQSLQPTGGDEVAGATAPFGGKGDHDGDGKAGGNAASQFFPVLIKRGYRPLTENWRIVKEDGSFGHKPTFPEGESPKVKPGYTIGLPIDEAKKVIRAGIGERADEIE